MSENNNDITDKHLGETTSPQIIKIETDAQISEMTLDEARRSGALKEIDKTLIGEDVYDFYFGGAVTKDIKSLLSDCVSRETWGALLEKYRDGKIDTDELTDVLLISHLHVGGNDLSTPEEIVDRAFETKFKGKLGRKLIANTIHALSKAQLLKAPENAVKALLGTTLAQSDHRHTPEQAVALSHSDQQTSIQIKDAATSAYEGFLTSLNVTDQVRDITLEQFLKDASDENNPYFDFATQMCFDIGWERPSKTGNESKCLALYFFELDKAWTDTTETNIKEADRHVSRWLIRDIKVGDKEKIESVKVLLASKFKNRLEEKLEFIHVMWDRGLG